MATWEQISRENYVAAQSLLEASQWRSAVSRAYFSSYSAVAAALVRNGVRFRSGREGPPHASLVDLILNHLSHLSERERRDVRRLIHMAYIARLSADYQPRANVDRDEARNAVRSASLVLKTLGIGDA